MWDAVFAPPINLPGFNFSSGVAARNKLLPIVQVSLNMSLQLPLLQIIAACTVQQFAGIHYTVYAIELCVDTVLAYIASVLQHITSVTLLIYTLQCCKIACAYYTVSCYQFYMHLHTATAATTSTTTTTSTETDTRAPCRGFKRTYGHTV